MRNRKVHRMGQVFLVNQHIAEVEAEHALGKTVLEIGPGQGILTKVLLKKAKKVIAVEKDPLLANSLGARIRSRKLYLINKDFLDTSEDELELSAIDIMISNIPYSLSGRIIEWLAEKQMQAVLCLQKEFVAHMLAKPDMREYSKLSVVTALSFRVTKIIDVPRGNFRPVPLVDSAVIYMKPLGSRIDKETMAVLNALMQHKKKTVRNAMMDSEEAFGKTKREMSRIMEKVSQSGRRAFKMNPQELLVLAKELSVSLSNT